MCPSKGDELYLPYPLRVSFFNEDLARFNGDLARRAVAWIAYQVDLLVMAVIMRRDDVTPFSGQNLGTSGNGQIERGTHGLVVQDRLGLIVNSESRKGSIGARVPGSKENSKVFWLLRNWFDAAMRFLTQRIDMTRYGAFAVPFEGRSPFGE